MVKAKLLPSMSLNDDHPPMWIAHSPDIPPIAPTHAAIDQAITRKSLSSSMISMILPIVSAPHVQIFSI
ncbi:hypothetical protein RhiirA5_365963 [Rhizophagus irregularis]|uniref:Uncharacterized protein n=1 Tax=Rhizophagus irregularis TaxID=588596 RepID=A0A2N0NZK2_9GLOM|nr:hypothetical protein RhiirA5_365963 [Rhizophagus irregularis]